MRIKKQQQQQRKIVYCKIQTKCHGLSLYTNSNFAVSKHSPVSNPCIGTITVQTTLQAFKNNIILVYRSPSTRPQTFIDLLTQLVSDGKPDILVGEFNLDVTSASYKQLTQSLSQYRQLVKEPTHNTELTLNIAFIRHTGNQPVVNVYPNYFSDHSIVLLTFNMA